MIGCFPQSKRFPCWGAAFGFVLIAGFLPSFSGCATAKTIRPPVFQHEVLVKRFFDRDRSGHYALTAQRGFNAQPAVTAAGAMFYTSSVEGSKDIWLRDLTTTVNVPLVLHDAEQHSPTVSPDGSLLVFVSEDRRSDGGLRLLPLPGGPKGIFQQILEGTILPSFWSQTQDLSALIEKHSQKLAVNCRGSFAEQSPAFSADGNYLYFSSDRCRPGTFNLWRMALVKGKLTGPPEQLTLEGGRDPAPSADGNLVAYLAHTEATDLVRSIFVRDLRQKKSRRIVLPAGPPDSPFYYQSPAVSLDGSTLFYACARRDSNRDGVIDERDDSAVYSLRLDQPDAAERRLLEDSFAIGGIRITPYLGGVLLYSAALFNSINVYLMRPEGVIPREENIYEQYRFTRRYRTGSLERYLLALDAVQAYWGSTPQYPLYEGRVLLDRIRRLKEESGNSALIAQAQERLRASAKANPFTALLIEIDRLESRGLATSQVVRGFVRAFPVAHARLFSAPVAAEMLAAALETLALALVDEGRLDQAEQSAERIVKEFPAYSRQVYARFLLGRIQLHRQGRVPGVLQQLAVEMTALPERMREGISAVTYNAFYSRFAPKRALERTRTELERQDLAPVLRQSVRLARARLLYDLDRFEESIAEARAVVADVPPRSGLYVRGWQSIAFASEKLGRHADAYDAKLRYGGAYSEASGAQVSEGEYLEIIEGAERQMNSYVRAARSLASAVEDADLLRGSVRRALQIESKVEISAVDREFLREFCRQDSQSWRLMSVLGRSARSYLKYCVERGPSFAAGGPLEAADVRTAVDLLFTGAYGAAARLNIMFLYMRSVDLFPELYEKRAVYYHRLKVDLAIEHSRRKLQWEEFRIRLLATDDLQAVLEVGDPFDSGAFDALADGYRYSLPDALKFDDMSMLYGYAYTLVRKSVQRERFYDRLSRSTLIITPERLADYKEAVLRDLKTAEYFLRYIIYRRPNEPDAYLLLGWMQQYIDDRRSSTVHIPETYVSDVLQYVTGTRSATPTDGRLFKDLHDAYFPGRLYESNVELYRLAIERTTGNAVAQANLNLNLANNYFRLLNFKKAVEHFNLAAAYMKRTERPVFRDYVQEALFYYNRGRALFYQGEPAAATEDFQRTYDIYDREERKPLFEQFSRLRYEKLSLRLSGAKDRYDLLLKKEKLLLQKVLDVNYKMALAAAMLGLAYWEAGEPEQAIEYYQDAEKRLYGGGTDPPDAIGRANLRNFIALAFQDRNRFAKSDEHARAAAEFAKKGGLSANRERFQPESIISRVLGCLLNYGEDFSVIGEGRNPFGFSPLRLYELSLGIQLENRILQGDLRGAERLLAERSDFFRSNDASVRQGQMALLTSTNTRALYEYQSGRYLEAAKLYGEAAEEAHGRNFASLYQMNLKNRAHVIFSALDRNLIRREDAIERLDGLTEDLAKFRENYDQQARLEYIKKQKPGFEFSPLDEELLQAQVQRDIASVVILQGLVGYYRGRAIEQTVTKPEQLAQANAAYSTSLKFLQGVTGALSGDRPDKVRASINLAVVEQGLGRLHAARARLRRARDLAFEFGMLREEWAATTVLADVNHELASMRPQGEYAQETLEQVRHAITLLRRHPFVFFDWLNRVSAFSGKAAGYLIDSGFDREALAVLEQTHQLELQYDYLRYPLRFAKADQDEAYRNYRAAVYDHIALRRAEVNARTNRGNAESLAASLAKSKKKISSLRGELLKLAPGHRPFLGFAPSAQPALRRGAVLLRLFRQNEFLHVWLFDNTGSDFVTVEQANLKLAAQEALKRLRPTQGTVREVFLLADRDTFSLPLEVIVRAARPGWPEPVFLTRLPRTEPTAFYDGQSEPPETINLVNTRVVRRLSSAADYARQADVVIAQVPSTPGTFPVSGKGRFDARLWFGQSRAASIVIMNGPVDYQRAAGLFEMLRANGAGTVLFAQHKPAKPADILSRAGQKPYTGMGLRVFGVAGFSAKAMAGLARRRAVRTLAQAKQLEADGKFEEARQTFEEAVSYAKASGTRALEFEARLLSAQRLIANTQGKSGKSEFDLLLKDFSSTSERLRSYQVLLGALYRVNQTALAETYVTRASTHGAAVGRAVRQAADVLGFVAALRRRDFGKQTTDFNSLYRRMYPDLLRSSEAVVAAEALRQRTLYQQALSLTGAATAARTQAARLNFFTTREASLLGYRIRRSPAPRDLEGAALLFSLAESGNWKRYAKELGAGEWGPESTFALAKFRGRLFTQWQAHLLSRQISTQDIADVPVDVGVTAYQRISDLERSMVFAMLLRALEYDPELQTAQNLRSLLKAERRQSHERAARMALLSARTLLGIGDALSAHTFLLAYEQNSQKGLAEARTPALAARIGAAMEAAGIEKMVPGKRGKKDLAEYRKRWLQAFSDPKVQKLAAIYLTIPKTFEQSEIARFNEAIKQAGRLDAELLSTLRIAAGILKQRAVSARRWDAAFDSAVFAQLVRQTAADRRGSLLAGRMVQYRAVAAALRTRLPKSQTLTALVDTNFRATRLRAAGGRWSADEMAVSGRYLRGRLLRFLEARQTGQASAGLHRELGQIYRSLFPASDAGVRYFWFEGVHAFAPIPAERGDRIFQVLDPAHFATAPAVGLADAYDPGFVVNAQGSSATAGDWSRRLDAAERLALGDVGYGGRSVLHVMRPIGAPVAESVRWIRAISGRGDRPWFLAANQLHRSFRREVDNMALLLYSLGHHFKRPGIVTLRKPPGLAHSHFVRHFYDRSNPAVEIDKRFVEASLRLRRVVETDAAGYGYRLVTPALIAEP